MPNFIVALREEVERLEGELSAHPLYMKLSETKKVLALYEQGQARADDASPSMRNQMGKRFASGVSAEVVRIVAKHLTGKVEPVPTRDIMVVLGEHGVEISADKPQNVVSSILSRANEFRSHGRSGWTLAEAYAAEKEAVDDVNPAREPSSTFFERQTDHLAEPLAEGREAAPGGGT